MATTMQAAVFHGANDLRVEEVPRPEAEPGTVVLAVERCGICGTDSHIVRGRFPAPNLADCRLAAVDAVYGDVSDLQGLEGRNHHFSHIILATKRL